MAGIVAAPEFRTWNAPGHALQVEYAAAVIVELQRVAVEGYHKVPHGGVEIGGVLFGTRANDLVRIQASRPIACEYSTGPSFVLSARDETALEQALQAWRSDPDLAGLEPVGWYHSHTRSEIFLTDLDLNLFARFFPQPWQVALVLRPASFAPTRAGFFFREPDGSIHAESSYSEFVVRVPRASEPVAVSPAAPAPVAAPPESESDPVTAPRRAPVQWYAAVPIVMAALAAGYWMWPTAPPRLLLSANDAGGQMHIAWDRAAGPVRDALRGSIQIDDGGTRTAVNLSPADLHSGGISYARRSGDVQVRLRVEPRDGQPLEETTRFLKPPTQAEKEQLQRETEAMRARIEQQKTELSQLEQMVDTIHKSASVPVPAPPKPRTAPAPVPQLNLPAARPTPVPVANLAPPPKIDLPSTPPATNILPAASSPVASPPPPVARPKVAPPPAWGRLIWTGKLAKNGRLVVAGNIASTGTLIGALPTTVDRVNAWPGDLTAAGMTVFTADTKHKTPLAEAPSASNGWQPTTYTWEPKRAAAVRVLEQPSADNGYKLVLQSDTGKLPVIVIEWHAHQ